MIVLRQQEQQFKMLELYSKNKTDENAFLFFLDVIENVISDWFGLVWFGGFYGTSTVVGYLTPNPFLLNNLFYLKQFSLA